MQARKIYKSDSASIRVAIRKSALDEEDIVSAGPVSPYLYIAGLLVTLSGLYAATYDMSDVAFANVLRLLAVAGYAVSYWMRRIGFDWKQYQVPVLAVFGLCIYYIGTTAPSISGAGSGLDIHPYQAQTVVVWIAVLQAFTLANDASVLFACVPAMALLGIMSSGAPDDEIQYAFIVFLASATFLMVHENHLRTSGHPEARSTANPRPALVKQAGSLLRGEVVIAVACVLATMLLARGGGPVLQVVGKAILPSTPIDAFKDRNNKNPGRKTVRVSEDPSIEIATGPRTESDTILLQVNSNVPITYLRGSSYDFFTGRSFEDHQPEPVSISPGPPPTAQAGDIMTQQPNMNTYNIQPSALEAGGANSDSGQACRQVITVRDGVMNHIYAAPEARIVVTPYVSLLQGRAGSLAIESTMVRDSMYIVSSRLPVSDPELLRKATHEFPAAITDTYLQLPGNKVDRLQSLATSTVSSLTTEYDRVMALRDAIAGRCAYTLQAAAVPRDRDVVDSFLFETKQGYCDSFAASLTVMCRYAGIPARMASGFLSGEKQGDGRYLVRERHKHVWTEVYFPDFGWVPFDATEGSQELKAAATAGTLAKSEGWRWLFNHGPLPIVILCTVLLLVGYLVKTELLPRLLKPGSAVGGYSALQPGSAAIAALYNEACVILASRGYVRAAHETPREFCTRIQTSLQVPQVNSVFAEITNLHAVHVYGSSVPGSAEIVGAKKAVLSLREAVRGVARVSKS